MADIVYPGQTPSGTIGTEFLPKNIDIVLYRGDYLEFFVIFTDFAGTPLDLNGYTPKVQFKTTYGSATATTVPVSLVDNNSRVRVYVSSAVTSGLTFNEYIWDLQITNALGDVRTLVTGDITVKDEVTT